MIMIIITIAINNNIIIRIITNPFIRQIKHYA